MADQEPAPFTVVDRRVASQETSDEAGEHAPETNLHTERTDAENLPSSEDQHVGGDAAQETEPFAEHGEANLPDASLYLSMAAMHIGTADLVKSLLPIFDAHAWQNMGLIANPITHEANKDLPAAQLAIDTVQFLMGKAEGSLSDTERRDLQRRLNDLRMNYLAKMREG